LEPTSIARPAASAASIFSDEVMLLIQPFEDGCEAVSLLHHSAI
jgi:hypothetical protein